MVELVYHDPSDRSGVSPFDRVIRNITEGEEALIACPYIAPDYLEDVTTQTEEWFLLTDVGEWLSVHGQTNREAIHEFLVEHRDRVRQVEDLHAKVVISGNRALIGSANFTTKGLTDRTEMSVLFDESNVVDELTDWFEAVWSVYSQPSIDRVEAYLETAPATPSPARNYSGGSFSAGDSPDTGTASLGRDKRTETTDDEWNEGHDTLVERVSKALSPEWINCYFDLLDDLISTTGLSNDDPRLVTSLPQDGRMPVSINDRYVLVAMRPAGNTTHGRYRDDYEERIRRYSERATTGFILGPETEKIEELVEQADFYFPFQSRSTNGEPPHYVEYIGEPTRMVDRDFKEAWLSAATEQIERAECSPYRRYHEPVVYEAARNREYRRKVIREAFDRD